MDHGVEEGPDVAFELLERRLMDVHHVVTLDQYNDSLDRVNVTLDLYNERA